MQKAAVDKEWDKHEKIPAWQMDKVKSKKDVVLEAHKRKSTLLHRWTYRVCVRQALGPSNFGPPFFLVFMAS